MNARSLRLRLLAGGAIAIFIALVVAWFAMTFLFERHLQRREADELTHDALQLIAGLHIDASGVPVTSTPPADPRYKLPASGFYWQISTVKQASHSRSLWDQALPAAPDTHDTSWQTRVIAGPFNQNLLVLERRVHLNNDSGGVFVQFARNEAAIGEARAEFGHELLLFLLGLWAVLSAAAALQVELGLRPLTKLRHALTALRANPSERLTVTDHPPEVEHLTRAINSLAEAREKDLLRARRRAADLAHGLKTPLAVLAAQSRRIRETHGLDSADGLDQAIAAAGAAIEAELARARAAAARRRIDMVRAQIVDVAESVIGVIERTETGARLVFEVAVPDDLRLRTSNEELAEILGALIENAARYAKRRVRVSASTDDASTQLNVEDDGPGIDERRMEEALTRGSRLDETGTGHGLGLAIARDLVEARGGTIALGRSDLGGLSVAMIFKADSD
ncbi:MAG TPA: sensor histidine kinase [Rhizomicrobium sp.]|nr:sensor histidine kinase [Rhizomicrobium sp.]